MSAELLAETPADLPDIGPRRAASAVGFVRSATRGFAFAFALAISALDYGRLALLSRGSDPRQRRARWLHRWCRVYACLIGLRLSSRGSVPRSGMIVSNHLSYLDIVALSALTPCVFVAKKEVASWPVFGIFARLAGTVFVDRSRRMDVAATNAAIEEALKSGAVVVLFAEGTSSGGQTVLPFRSSLLGSAAASRGAVVPAAIHYQIADGSVPDEVCYWGDMTLLPHLINLLGKRQIQTQIAFGSPGSVASPRSRKEAAVQLRDEVAALHGELAVS
ncbi:MAG: lysophospholipid acyltransferase family protein [Chthoniobacteraceae bacterium]